MAKEDLIPIKTTERAKELGAKGGKAKKGSIHLSTRIKNMLDDPDFEQKLTDGTVLKGQPIEAIMRVVISKAISGDIRFIDWLAKYGYGDKHEFNINIDPAQRVVERIDKIIEVEHDRKNADRTESTPD